MGRQARQRWLVALSAVIAAGAGCSASPKDGVEIQSRAATAPIAFVQGTFADPQTPQSAVNVTFTGAQAAGDLDVVAVGWSDSTSSVAAVTDSAGNVYQLAVGPTRIAGIGSQSIYYAQSIAASAAGANTVHVTFSAAVPFPDVRVAEYSGIDPANALDVAVGATGTNNNSNSGSVTTTFANDLLVGANLVATSTVLPGSGFTSRMISSPDGDILEDRTVTATGSLGASAGLSAAGGWVMQMAAFRAATLAPDTQPPTAPANLTATASSSTQINLAWTASTDNIGVTGYLVERCQGAGCSSFTQVGTSASTSFSSGGLTPSTSYSFRVRAVDAAANTSGYSNTATAATQAGPPPAPAFVQGGSSAPQSPQSTVTVTYNAAESAGDLNVVIVGWNDSTSQVTSVSDAAGNNYVRALGPTVLAGIASQSIYYAPNIAGASAGNVVTVHFNQAARFADVRILEYHNVDPTNPVDGAIGGTGTGNSSNSGSLTTTNAVDLLVAGNVVETSTLAAGSGFTSRMITQDGDIAEDRVTSSAGSVSATGPLSGANGWVMQLVAFRAAPVPDTMPPTAPSNLTATTASTSQINLAWTAATDNVGITGYRVERCQGAGCSSFAQVGTAVAGATTFADSGLTSQTSYSYRVRATDAAGNLGAYSNTASAATPADLGAACTAAADCGSGFCADGVCCNVACTGNACMACNVASSAGTCSPKPAGTACDDGNACTQVDTCQAGACVGASPVVCTASDQCHVAGACDPATGACSNPAAANGTACNDGNACTQGDTCQAGACASGSPVVCAAQDQCHLAGSCNPATGVCSNPGKPGGSTLCGSVCVDALDDALNCGSCNVACVDGQSCLAGVCRAGLSQWPTVGGGVRHSGANANETGTPPLTLAWSQPLSTGALWPAASDGATTYVTQNGMGIGPDRHLWALSGADGHLLWSHNFGDVNGISQPTVSSGRVYIGESNNSGDTFMYSFAASNGASVWIQPFNSQWESYWAPLVVGGQMYFDGGSFGGLYGLATSNGAQLFFNNQLEQFDEWSPLALGGRIYTFVNGNLRAHDPQSGAILSTSSVTWNWAGWSMMTAPVSDGSEIYVIAPPSLYAFQPGNSLPDWTQTDAYVGMPAVAGGVVYAVSGGQLRAHDAASGQVLWTFAGDSELAYPPTVAGQWVYAASDANVYAVDTTTQQAAWSATGGGWLSIAGGSLYIARANGTLSAYAFTGGNVTNQCAGAPDGTPCTDGNACTQVDTCQAGMCVGSSPVVCGALDQCHLAGACDPSNGRCTSPLNPAGGTLCASACVDINSDPANCGACGNACGAGQTCSAGACQAFAGWTTLGGDVHHSGSSPHETGTPPLSAAWTQALSTSPLWPAVSDGTAVYVSEKTYFTASTRLWAVSPSDGHPLWTHDFGNVFSIGQPTVAAGQVYIAEMAISSNFLHSFTAATGAQAWSQPFNSQGDRIWAPLVVGSRMYFDGGYFDGLYGLSTPDGAQLFFNNQLEQVDQWSPVSAGGKIYTFVGGHLRAHDPQTGAISATTSVVWNQFEISGLSLQTSPVSDGTRIFAISPPDLHAFRADTAALDWSANGAYTSTPAVAGGVVYAISGGQLRALDAGIGTPLWSVPADGALSFPPAVAGHFVYVASNANVYAVDTTTQQVAWSGGPGGWLSIAGGNLYVAQANGALTAYALTH
jgi:chitodextrinase